MSAEQPPYSLPNNGKPTAAERGVSSEEKRPLPSKYEQDAAIKRIKKRCPEYVSAVSSFDPVTNSEYMQTFFAAAVLNKWSLRPLKKKFQYLLEQAYREEEVSTDPPEYRNKQLFYDSTTKSSAGILLVSGILEDFHFKPLPACPVIFRRSTGSADTYLLLFADDVYLASASRAIVEKVAADIENCQRIHYFSKIELAPKLTTTKCTANITSEEFINAMLNQFEENVKQGTFKYNDPMLLEHFKIVMGESIAPDLTETMTSSKDIQLYQRTVRGLRYLALHTRPEIALVTKILNQEFEPILKLHWFMLLQVLHYLHVTKPTIFQFKEVEKPQIKVYYDTYFNSEDYGFQTLGFCILLGESLLKWTVDVRDPISRPREEYMHPRDELETLRRVIVKTRGLKTLLGELGVFSDDRQILYTSDKAAWEAVSRPGVGYLSREDFYENRFDIQYISRADNLARLFAQPMSAHQMSAKPFSDTISGFPEPEGKCDLNKLFSQ